jgi:hypothetical protein
LSLVFLGCIFPIFDNDVWWHLKTGQFIVSNLKIPFTDPFSYTIAGKPWISFEWLSEGLLFIVSSISGLAGLTIFKAFLVSLLFLILIKTNKGSNRFVLLVILGISFFALRDGLRERPQIFSYLFTALFILILRLKSSKQIYLLPALQILWANLHGASCFVGFGLTAIYMLFEESYSFKTKVIVTASVFLAIFINPHTYKVLLYLFVFFNEGFNKLILEYQSPQFNIIFFPYFILVIMTLSVFFLDEEKSMTDILTVGISLAASFLAIRNIPLFVIMAGPVTAYKTTKILKKRLPDIFKNEYQRLNNGFLFNLLISSIFLCVFYASSKAIDINNKYAFGVGDSHRVKKAAEFVQVHKIQGNIFNDYDFGGYLIYKLYPEQKVFVDGRLVEYGFNFVKDSFYYFKPEVWAKLDRQYSFNAAVIAQESYYPAKIFDEDKIWALVYWDDNTLVYVRNNIQNSSLIRSFSYNILKPNSPDQSYLKSYDRQSVEKEILRSMYLAPYCQRAKALKGLFDKMNRKI